MRFLSTIAGVLHCTVSLIYAVFMTCLAAPFVLIFFLFTSSAFLFKAFMLVNSNNKNKELKALPSPIYPLKRCLILRYRLPDENDPEYRHYVVAGNAITDKYCRISTQNEYARDFFKVHNPSSEDEYIQGTAQAIVWLRKKTSHYEIQCQVYSAELESDGSVTMKLIHF